MKTSISRARRIRAFCTVLIGMIPLHGTSEPPPFTWLDNLDAARAEATRQQKPLLILFRCVP